MSTHADILLSDLSVSAGGSDPFASVLQLHEQIPRRHSGSVVAKLRPEKIMTRSFSEFNVLSRTQLLRK